MTRVYGECVTLGDTNMGCRLHVFRLGEGKEMQIGEVALGNAGVFSAANHSDAPDMLVKMNDRPTGTGPIIRNRLLHIVFLIFRVFWIHPQAFSIRPSLADAN